MAVVSDIEIRLRADIARLQQDMDRARREVSSTMSNITSVVKGAMGALAAIGGIAAFAGFIKSAIDATDAVSDISQRTGVAIKDIAGLQLWFQIGGAEAGEFESSMIKLSKAIATNGDAFKRIGVSTREANGALRSNVDVIRDSADALAKMQDGTAKTALAIELFGKSGATLIPILNSGSQGLQEMTEMAEKLGLTYDEKVVEQAGKFNDTLDFLGLAAQGVGRQVAAQLLPSLNSLAGSFLKFVTQSNAIKKACEAIVFGFKTVYTFGVTVGTMFQTLGTIIGGTLAFITNNLSTIALGLKQAIEGDYSKAWATLTSGGKAAGAIVSATFNDIKTDISAAATTIGEVWTNSGGDAIEALAAMNKQSKYVSEEERKEMEKRAAAWAQYKRTLDDARDASEREASGLPALSAAEKAHLDLTRDLADGKIKLTKAQEDYARGAIDEAGANVVLAKSMKDYQDLQEGMAKSARDLGQARANLIKSAEDEAEQNEWLVKTFGMTEDAVIRMETARTREQMVQQLGRDLNQDEIDDLERLAELKERSAKAVADRRALEETKQFWTDIEKTAHDTFVSIADGGKNAFQRLKDTAKNVFFDWLYQQTLKKWIVNIQTNGTQGIMSSLSDTYSKTGGGVGGLFEAGKTIFAGFSQNLSKGLGETIMKFGSAFGSKAATSFGSSISSSTSAGGIAGAIVAGMMANNKFYDQGWRIDGQVGDIISSQLKSMFKGNGFAPITAIMTASMASFEKLLGGLGVNGKFASMLSGSAVFARAFGRKAPSLEAQGLQGTISASGFNGNLFADILEKGGWFRSDKRYTNTSALSGDQDKAFDTTIKGMVDSVRAFGVALGAETSVIDGYSKQLKLTFTKDDAENQKMIAEAFAGIGDDLAVRLIPNIENFNLGAETASETLQRLAGEFTTTGALIEAMGLNVQTVFGTIGIASLEARDRLVRFAGGIDALAQQSTFFSQNFLTEAEQIAPLQRQVNEQLAALGYAGVATADQFKSAVLDLANSGRLATEEGAKTYAGLLALAPGFKTVTDYLTELSEAAAETVRLAEEAAARELADQQRILAEAEEARLAVEQRIAQERQTLQDELDELTMTSAELLKKQRDALDPANRSLFDHIQAVREQQSASQKAAEVIQAAAQASLAAMQSLGGAVLDAMTGAKNAAAAIRDFSNALNLGNLSALDPDAQYREAKRLFDTAKTEDLTAAAQAFLEASKNRGADSFYYDRDFSQVQARLLSAAKEREAYAAYIPSFYASLSAPPQVIVPPTFPLYDEIQSSKRADTPMSQTAVVDLLEVMAEKITQLTDQFDNASEGGQGLRVI